MKPVDRALAVIRENKPKNALTFFKLLLAAASMILRPVIVEPVKATLSTSGCAAKAAPPTGPREGTVLITPGGKLYTTVNTKKDEKMFSLPGFFNQLGKFLIVHI